MEGDERSVGQSGGVNISGSTRVGGDIVGRDKTTTTSPAQLEELFLPLINTIRAAPPEKQEEAFRKAEILKSEVAKGKGADDTVLAKLLDGIVKLIPNAATALGSAFGTPILGSISGPVTKFVLDTLQGK